MKLRVILCCALVLVPSFAHAKTATTIWRAKPPFHIVPAATGAGYSPSDIRNAYGIPGSYSGVATKIAIVDAYVPNQIKHDLDVFSSAFKLPAMASGCSVTTGPHPCLQVVGGSNSIIDAGWATEADLDVEWAHAIAPQADIVVVSATSDSLNDLMAAVDKATVLSPNVVSLSWGGNEFSGETALASHFNNPTITYVASSGDSGTGTSFPAVIPSVLSVGGTSLHVSGRTITEVAWKGSGGGISKYFAKPTYQNGFVIGTKRAVPDVSYNADPATGYRVYSSKQGWIEVGGTSAGAPQWAALIAGISSQNRSRAVSNLYFKVSLFRDIISGKNGSCAQFCVARDGFDTVTGLGSPKASLISTLF